MGRPRKYPLPEAPPASLEQGAAVMPPTPEPEPDDEELAEEPEPEELVSLALDNPRMRLTPAMVAALSDAWKDNVKADDDEGKAHARRIAARLKRASHAELHPGCQRVSFIVPTLKRRNGGIWYVKINERAYVGRVTVWECEARTIWNLVYNFETIENERMDETRSAHPTFDLDTGVMLAERARLIREA
jgi:hypothetical protein